MNNTAIEQIIHETFSGLVFFYRDTELEEKLISKYTVGQIIMERAFTDVSHKGGGLATNFRYLIASSQARDLSAFKPDAEKTGHVVLLSNAFFKVLDIYKTGNKTQVFLLHIPETAVDFFAKATTNLDEKMITEARANFDAKANTEPVAELQQQDWKERTSFPIGMSEAGEFFTPEAEIEKKPWWKFW